ncbi:cytochrome c [Microvirga massiliensis]|uniref:cytochrome c n=1 Tax=Microvirga massiliensis TaxID=1033741 RepID=UPI00062BEDB2|nr:cytochrome c [Microvirga massiliensis]
MNRLRSILLALLGLVIAGAAVFYLLTEPALYRLVRGEQSVAGDHVANLENGRLLFNAGGCSSCHATPDQDDRTRLGGGLALKSPFGTFHVPNISPHPRDGIGGWSVTDFVRAMREGTAPDGKHLYPSFPYTSYQRMRTTDIADLFAYLKSLTPVEGRVRDHELSFPYNIRRGLGLWKLAFLDGNVFRPDPNRDEPWNRGAYLVEGPGHCAECHSPRNALGAIISERRFAGAREPDGKDWVPNITPHPTGTGGWTLEDFEVLLKTGDTPNFVDVGGLMRAVVRNTAALPESDRTAMGEYLLTLPPREGRPPAATNSE